jgi:L,D-transpeptidase catalytic domain
MKRLVFIIVITVFFFTVVSAAWYVSKLHRTSREIAHNEKPVVITDVAFKEKINNMAAMAKQYAASNKFSTQYCFLVDMSIESGKQRFFVYDMKKNTVLMTGLVANGRCNKNWLAGRQYGNGIGCGCTSLGKYKVGKSYQGKFGLAYKLYGLDNTNSNAYARFVVLHSMQCVPEKEVDPYPICQSDGCPTVSPGFLNELSSLINNSTQTILLWIFE